MLLFSRIFIVAAFSGAILCLAQLGQAQPTLPVPSAAPQGAPKKAYRLAANDVVQISVYQESDLDAKVRIARDGSVTLPLLGDVKLGEKTVEEATVFIRERLKDGYLVNPQVTLTIADYGKRRFTILGKVQRTGAYEMPDEKTVTLLEAIAAAGGYAPNAKEGAITVSRIVGDKKMVYTLDASAMARNKDAPTFEIQPDDLIHVPERIF